MSNWRSRQRATDPRWYSEGVEPLTAKHHTAKSIKLKTQTQEGPTIYMLTETLTKKVGPIMDETGQMIGAPLASHQTDTHPPAIYYTDGALHQGQPVIMGAAGICTEGQHAGKAWICRPSGWASSTKAELIALQLVLPYALTDGAAIIHLDNQSVVHTWNSLMESPPLPRTLHRLSYSQEWERILHLCARCPQARVKLQWVKGHSGIEGNELADKLARKALSLPTPRSLPPSTPCRFTLHTQNGPVESSARRYLGLLQRNLWLVQVRDTVAGDHTLALDADWNTTLQARALHTRRTQTTLADHKHRGLFSRILSERMPVLERLHKLSPTSYPLAECPRGCGATETTNHIWTCPHSTQQREELEDTITQEIIATVPANYTPVNISLRCQPVPPPFPAGMQWTWRGDTWMATWPWEGARFHLDQETWVKMNTAATAQGLGQQKARLEKVTQTLEFYKDGTTTDTGGVVDLNQHWSTPSALVEILRKKLELTREWFASALNFNPAFERSYSARKEDAAFGLKFDAYSQVGEHGAHYGYANPEYKSKAMHEMVDAIDKIMARQDPVRVVSIVPSTDGWAFDRHAHQRGAQTLCIFEPGTLCFQAASHRTSPTIRLCGAIKRRVVIHLWSNTAGRADEEELQSIRQALEEWKRDQVATLHSAKWKWTVENLAKQWTGITFSRLREDIPLTPTQQCLTKGVIPATWRNELIQAGVKAQEATVLLIRISNAVMSTLQKLWVERCKDLNKQMDQTDREEEVHAQHPMIPRQRAPRQLTRFGGRHRLTTVVCQRLQCGRPKSDHAHGETSRHALRCPDGKGSYSYGNPAQCKACDGRHRYSEAVCITHLRNTLMAHQLTDAKTGHMLQLWEAWAHIQALPR